MEIVSKRWVSGVQLKAGFLAKGIVLKHSMLRLQGWRMRHRGRSFQFFVAHLVNPVTLSFADFQPQNLNWYEIVSHTIYSCCVFVTWCWICSVSNSVKKSLFLLVCISFVFKLLPSLFLSAAWATPFHLVTISRFKIGFEFIKVQVIGCHLPYGWENGKHFTELYWSVTESNLLVVLNYHP